MFAVIGDFGADNADEAAVAKLVASWKPDFVVTVGDNNYDGPGKNDVDIGKYYASFIGNYKGSYGAGSPTNRFWPSPGNHDWDANALRDYVEYFTLPGNERYYDKALGLVHLFAVDSDDREPDGITPTSTQGQWLKGALAASTACYKVVYFHHAPYTSGNGNGPTPEMRWPFKDWGATVVISGHEHLYERLEIGGQLYLIDGLGGDSPYAFGTPVAGSKVRYSAAHGAMRVFATKAAMTYEFWNVDNDKIDTATTLANCP
jgi:hypothetical protein